MKTISTVQTAENTTLFAFPAATALSQWATKRVLMAEIVAGYYAASVDESIADLWYLFDGSVQPVSYESAKEVFNLNVGATTGSGQFVTMISVSASSAAVSGALITIQQSGVIVAWGYSGADGSLTFALNAGTYTVSITATGFAAIVASSFTVSGDSTVSRTLTVATVIPPATLNACRVQIKAMRGGVTKQVRVVINSGDTGRKGELAFMQVAFDGLTDNVGAVAIDLPWSSTVGIGKYRFRFFDVNSGVCLHDRTCTVADVSNANYEDLQ